MPARISLLFILILLLLPISSFAQEQRNVNVNAVVPADPEDFQIDLDISPEGSPYAQDTNLEYTITYGSYLSGATGEMIIQAQWELGQLSTGSVPVLEYVIGSGTNAYANTAPVINPVNRTITWTIPNLPANTTDQTVSFKLKTVANYTGDSRIAFSVSAKLSAVATETPPEVITRQYLFNGLQSSSQSPTNTPTPGPSQTPTPTPTPTQTVTEIDVSTISSDNAEITVALSDPGTVTLLYGTDPGNLSTSLTSLTPKRIHTLRIPDLLENTQYYFRIQANINGEIIESDIFTFTTGKDIPGPKVNTSSVILVSDEIVVHNGSDKRDEANLIPIPQNKDYHLTFNLVDRDLLENIIIEVRDRSVLGINTYGTDYRPIFVTDVLEVKPGTFSTSLKAPETISTYDVIARIFDTNGNITEIPLVSLQVVTPLRVVDSQSNEGIEHARVLLSLWNERKQTFERISNEYYPLTNPSYSEPNGQIHFVLPIGRYKAEVSAIGYAPKELEFMIFGGEESPYPRVALEKQPFSLIDAGMYYTTLTGDLIQRSLNFSKDIGESQRFFRLTAYGAVGFFIFLSFLSLSQKVSVPLHLLPRYMLNRIKALSHKEDHTRKDGTIVDSTSHNPISGVHVALLDVGSGKIIAETSTNYAGKFTFKKMPEELHAVVILTKNNYYPSRFSLPGLTEEANGYFALTTSRKDHVIAEIIASLQNIIELLFNALLGLSFLSSILLGIFFGLFVSLPFILLSSLNLFLWLVYIHTKRISTS